jgi:ketosteroid isomerase-like protein
MSDPTADLPAQIAALTEQVQWLTAYEEIRQLASRYAVALDRRDFGAVAALFVDDVRAGRDAYGRDALQAGFVDQMRSMELSILNVGTHQIDLIDADHATGHVYCKGEVQDGERLIHQAIRYDDTYERRDGHWYFVKRKHLLFYGAEVGVDPLTLPPANWPEHHDGRGTLPQSEPTWQAFHRPG